MNIKSLIANLASEDETERSNAAEDLGYANAAETVAPLVERLCSEPSRKVRETIFLALERIEGPEALSRVGALLDSDDAFLRNQAVALLQRRGVAAVPVLLERMQDVDADVRKFVVDTAAGISSPAVEAIYERALRDPDVNVVIAALEPVGEQRKTRFKPAVEEVFLKATEPMLVCAAFSTLLQIGDVASWECVRQRYPTAASVPKWELVWWIRALGNFALGCEVEVFHEILRQHNGRVARETIDALERFQVRHGHVEISEGFWTTLRGMLQANLAPENRLQLLRVAGGFGAPAGIADFLKELLRTGDRLTKLGAIEGIKRLGRSDLLEWARDQRRIEPDEAVAEALGEC